MAENLVSMLIGEGIELAVHCMLHRRHMEFIAECQQSLGIIERREFGFGRVYDEVDQSFVD